MNSNEMAKAIYNALDDKKAEDVTIIDIRGISILADYFIVANGSSQTQLLAMQNEVDKVMHENGIESKQIEGNRTSTWILMDYKDVIVHLFSKEDRLFYDLERIWQDGKQITIEDL